MAVQTPPFVLQNSSHGSELVRREALASLAYGTAGGVVPATPTSSANLTAGVAGCSDLKVNAPASGMSCLVNPGQCYVPGSLGSGSGYGIGTGYGMPTVTLNGGSIMTVASNAHATVVQLTTQGVYYCYNDNASGQVSLTVAASNATNPRIDVVIAQVEDASYSGSNNDWKLAVVTGTAAASPTVPSLPANALVLAYLWIPASSTSVTAGNILDLRVACNRNPYRAKMWRSAAYTFTAGSQIIPYDTVEYDLTGAITTGASASYTCPVSGLYSVKSSIGLTPTASGIQYGLTLNKNGSGYEALAYQVPGSTTSMVDTGSVEVPANQGDVLTLLENSSSGTFPALVAGIYTFAQFALISPI